MTINGVKLSDEYCQRLTASAGKVMPTGLDPEKIIIEHELFRQECVRRFGEPTPKQIDSFFPDYARDMAVFGDGFAKLPPAEQREEAKQELEYRRLCRAVKKEALAASDDRAAKAYYAAHRESFAMREGRIISRLNYARPDDLNERLELIASLEDDRRMLARGDKWDAIFKDFLSEAEDASAREAIARMNYQIPVFRGDLPKEVEDALFALPDGGISEVIQMGKCICLCKIIQHLAAEKDLPFEWIKGSVYERMNGELIGKALDKLSAELAAKAKIER